MRGCCVGIGHLLLLRSAVAHAVEVAKHQVKACHVVLEASSNAAPVVITRMHQSTLSRTALSVQGNFYSDVFPMPDLADDKRRQYVALVKRGGQSFYIQLTNTSLLAVIHLLYVYIIIYLGGPESLLCFPSNLKQLVRMVVH
jgi:hypothetical protein